MENITTKLQQLTFYVKQTSDKNEMIFRCPLHEDRHGHLYVSSNLEYICFKCGVKGNNFLKFLLKHNSYLDNNDKQILIDILSNLMLSETHEHEDTVRNDEKEQEIDEQKVRLFHELKILLKNYTKRNKQIIYKYLSDTRNITDRDYIDDLIEQGYILFYSKKLYRTVNNYTKSIFGKKMIYVNQAIGLTVPNSGMLQFRVIDKDTNIRYYILKSKEISPNTSFYIGNTRNPQTCIIVEGIFDAIKLDYLLREHMDNYIVVALTGKTNVNTIIELQNLLRYNVSVYIIALDMDVDMYDIKRVYNKINENNQNMTPHVYVLTKKNNDVTDKDFDNIHNFDEFKKKFVLVNYVKYITNIWKLSNLFDVEE